MCVCSLKKFEPMDRSGWNLVWRWCSRGKVLGGGGRPGTPTQPPTPGMGCIKGVLGASVASTLHFGKNFIKQKLQGAPDLVGAGHLFGPQIRIRKDLGPMSFWSHGHSLWKIAYKIKCVVYVPNSYLVKLDTLYPDPVVQVAQKGAQWGSGASAMHFGGYFIKQKLLGTPNLVGVGHLIGP